MTDILFGFKFGIDCGYKYFVFTLCLLIFIFLLFLPLKGRRCRLGGIQKTGIPINVFVHLSYLIFLKPRHFSCAYCFLTI